MPKQTKKLLQKMHRLKKKQNQAVSDLSNDAIAKNKIFLIKQQKPKNIETQAT